MTSVIDVDALPDPHPLPSSSRARGAPIAGPSRRNQDAPIVPRRLPRPREVIVVDDDDDSDSDSDEDSEELRYRPRRRFFSPPPPAEPIAPPIPPVPRIPPGLRIFDEGLVRPLALPFDFENRLPPRPLPQPAPLHHNPLHPPPQPRPYIAFGGALLHRPLPNYQPQQPPQQPQHQRGFISALRNLVDLVDWRRNRDTLTPGDQHDGQHDTPDEGGPGLVGLRLQRVEQEERAAEYRPEWTHPSVAPGFVVNFGERDDEEVKDKDSQESGLGFDKGHPIVLDDADEFEKDAPPVPEKKGPVLVCVKCKGPLTIRDDHKLWAMRCGHVICGPCYQDVSAPLSDSLVDTPLQRLPTEADDDYRSRLRSASHSTSPNVTKGPSRKRPLRKDHKEIEQLKYVWKCPAQGCSKEHESVRTREITTVVKQLRRGRQGKGRAVNEREPGPWTPWTPEKQQGRGAIAMFL